MAMFDLRKTFLSLVRLGIGNELGVQLPKDVDWDALDDLAARQGLIAIMVDGVERLPEGQRPPKPVLLQWIGETSQDYEYRYEQYRHAIAEMAEFYNSHGFKMMVMKGFACSLNWSKPCHRPCGDIDIWLFGRQKEADVVLATEKEVKIDKSHHHHTVFHWGNFMVENHYDFVNVHNYQSTGIEKVFKELGADDSYSVEVYGEKVYLPSPDLHALFLLRHALIHFAAIGINLRQVLDWAFFVEKHTGEIDWEWFNEMLEKFYMKDFYSCINAICVEDLGFDATIFHNIQFDPALKDRVLQDILTPEYGTELPKYLIPRIFYKFKRWRGNAWKRELCYNESTWSAFWSGVWSHLLKPSSI